MIGAMGPRAKSWLFLVSRERCRNSFDGEVGGATAWPTRETLRPSRVDGIDCLRIVLARVPAKADPGSHLREVKLSTTRRGARALLLDHLRKEIGCPGKCGPSAVVTSRRARCHRGARALRRLPRRGRPLVPDEAPPDSSARCDALSSGRWRPLRGARRWLVQSSPSFGGPSWYRARRSSPASGELHRHSGAPPTGRCV